MKVLDVATSIVLACIGLLALSSAFMTLADPAEAPFRGRPRALAPTAPSAGSAPSIFRSFFHWVFYLLTFPVVWPILVLSLIVLVLASTDPELTRAAPMIGIGAALVVAITVIVTRFIPGVPGSLLGAVLTWAVFGWITLWNINPTDAQSNFIVIPVAIVLGLSTPFTVRFIAHHSRQLTLILGLATAGLLVLPRLVGKPVNGAYIDVQLGGLSLQVGEITRVCLILFMGVFLSDRLLLLRIDAVPLFGKRFTEIPGLRRFSDVHLAHKWDDTIRRPPLKDLLPLAAAGAATLGLLAINRDLGTAVVLFATAVCTVTFATQRGFFLVASVPIFILALVIGFHFANAAQFSNRVDAWAHQFEPPVDGRPTQLDNGLHMLTRGDLFGVGVGNGVAVDATPEVNKDLVLVVVGEEFGFLGVSGFLMTVAAVGIFGVSAAGKLRHEDPQIERFLSTVAFAAGVTILFQVFVVGSGVSALLPLTGLPVPFMSRGAMSILGASVLFGLIFAGSSAASASANYRSWR